MVTKVNTSLLILLLSLVFTGTASTVSAQLPIRTGAIEQFCLSRYSYSQKLQNICRERQAAAVVEFQEIQKKAPVLSNARTKIENCLRDNFSDGNGYDWIAVVRCAK